MLYIINFAFKNDQGLNNYIFQTFIRYNQS